jgi:hypothetical protein
MRVEPNRIFSSLAVVLAAAGCLGAEAPSSEAVGGPSAARVLPRGASPVRRGTVPVAAMPRAPRTRAYGQLLYWGGRVISNVKVYDVQWGPDVEPTLRDGAAGFYAAVTDSEYFDWLSEYDTAGLNGQDGRSGSNQHIGRGSFGGQYTITPSATGTHLTNAQIGAELAAQIAAGKLPAPDVDAGGNVNSIYMFDFPPGVDIDLDGAASCQVFCAYHNTVVVNGKSVPYSVLPDQGATSPCSGGCGSGTPFENATAVLSHELIEAVTDPEIGLVAPTAPGYDRPAAWGDNHPSTGEIGDICNGMVGTVAGYNVQLQWSNAQGDCVLTGPTTTACTPGSCSGALSVCETTGAKAGQCVACSASDSFACTGASPLCDTASDTCVSCLAPSDCPATECQSATCDRGACGTAPVQNGTACSTGHCQSGACVSANPGPDAGPRPDGGGTIGSPDGGGLGGAGGSDGGSLGGTGSNDGGHSGGGSANPPASCGFQGGPGAMTALFLTGLASLRRRRVAGAR